MHGSPSESTPRGTPSRRGKSPRFASDSPAQPGSSTLPTSFHDKPVATFISSLGIPVEGAISLDPDSTEPPSSRAVAAREPNTESKRAPRKSKTDALAALNNHARSVSMDPDDNGFEDSLTDIYRDRAPIPVSPKLDLSTVKTSSPRDPIPETEPRLFGLQNCPEFRPTMEEFRDPMAYIRSISDRGKEFGIVKIIPPEEWKMPFVTDTEVRLCVLCLIF